MGGRIIMEMLGQNHSKILTVSESSPGNLSLIIEDHEKTQRMKLL